MAAATIPFPCAAQIARAADNDEVYADLRAHLSDSDKPRFDAAVDAAYTGRIPLTTGEQRVLKFQATRPRYRTPGAFEEAIREEFAMSATRYYQVLNRLIDRPEAADYAPLVVKLLLAQRNARRAARSAANLAKAA